MVAISRVNPNFPIPGIDQSSKGFRDNFSAIKTEIEALQGKNIVLTGDVLAGPTIIDSGNGDIVIDCTVAVANVAAGGGNLTIQYNNSGVISGASSFVFIPSNQRVGIGSTIPSSKLDVAGNGRFLDGIHIGSSNAAISPSLTLEGTDPTSASLEILAGLGQISINSQDGYPIVHAIGTYDMVNISNVGIAIGNAVTTSTSMMDVYSSGEDISRIYGTADYTDHAVRISVAEANSTAGVILEQRSVNSVVGMRIDSQGNLTLHTGESMDAQLSTSSAQILIDRNGQVGIGTTTPNNRLAVNGSMWINSYIESDPPEVIIATPFIAQVVDSWNMNRYRSAEYTVQVTNPATGDMDVSNILLVHANGNPYYTIYANVNSAGSLGLVSTQVDGSQMQLIYTPNVANVSIKIDSYYITV